MIATEQDIKQILCMSHEYFFSHSDRRVDKLCQQYERACDERGIPPAYDEATLDRLGIRLGMIAEANHEGGGLIPYCVWREIDRRAPLLAVEVKT